jgi:hypothetical protein
METDAFFFHRIEVLVKGHATYSEASDTWIISMPRLLSVYQQSMMNAPRRRRSLEKVLEEGVRKGLWEMDYDDESESDIVVLC